jgi:hypothetical protein
MESVFPGAVLYFALDPTNKDIEGYNQLGIKSTVKVCVWVCGCVGVWVWVFVKSGVFGAISSLPPNLK